MTNAQIIFNASQRLLREGKLQPTGRTLTFETPDGSKIEMPETEAIHTFNGRCFLKESCFFSESQVERIPA